MTVNISVVGIENGVPVLTDEIDSSRHCIHNSNDVWHILHYLFRKRYILSSILLILALIYKLSVLHCKLFAEVTGIQTFNDGITSKYIWISGILRNVMFIELIKYISYFIYMVISKEKSLRNIKAQHATTITITERKLISNPSKPAQLYCIMLMVFWLYLIRAFIYFVLQAWGNNGNLFLWYIQQYLESSSI